MRTLFIILFLVFSYSFSSGCETVKCVDRQFNNLTYKQKQTIAKAYRVGKPVGLGYAMGITTWIESGAGENLVGINWSDGLKRTKSADYGAMQINILTVMNHYKSENPGRTEGHYIWRSNKYAQKLVTDLDFSFTWGLWALSWWQDHHETKGSKTPWSDMMKSYRFGFRIGGEEAKLRLSDVKLKLQVLKKYVPLLEKLK